MSLIDLIVIGWALVVISADAYMLFRGKEDREMSWAFDGLVWTTIMLVTLYFAMRIETHVMKWLYFFVFVLVLVIVYRISSVPYDEDEPEAV